MTQSTAARNGLNALLTPEESVLILIDHQPSSSLTCTAASRR